MWQLEEIDYMTCMTLSLLGNYAQTGHFGGPLVRRPRMTSWSSDGRPPALARSAMSRSTSAIARPSAASTKRWAVMPQIGSTSATGSADLDRLGGQVDDGLLDASIRSNDLARARRPQ